MTNYYSKNLSSLRLKKCYDLATPRINKYLDAEIDFILSQIDKNQSVLELGCGYGRILKYLCQKSDYVYGIDNSINNLLYAKKYLSAYDNYHLSCMDAVCMGLKDASFDVILCVQNGISAFHVETIALLNETLRICKPGGTILFSSYSEKIWDARLKWFKIQADAGLLGEIDFENTKDGNIVCKDGFTATTLTENDFRKLTEGIESKVEIIEIDNSSLFCQIKRSNK